MNAPAGSDSGEIYVYGTLSDSSWWGDEVTPKAFKADLDAMGDVSELHLYINSPGGDPFAATAIGAMLTRHKASVTVHVDGLAASAASILAMHGDTIAMAPGAMMMIHNAWGVACGNANELRSYIAGLEAIDASMRDVYAKRSGKSPDEITALMDAETWMTAQEAIDMGFADEISGKQVLIAACADKWVVNGVLVPEKYAARLQPMRVEGPSHTYETTFRAHSHTISATDIKELCAATAAIAKMRRHT